ncbi:Spinocerebellar ataxia type 10 protein domain containing protein, putative [Trypanosoma equiperdum]|uniref:Spinocerebellar ataxia type 10 protein domain containing protein, putative n=1 Tax=Trypanosoma equiperdum TaxID=5694 RepID=A0A1G4IB51_TRYEQ|nr:Spinocerebellar ataxia type 10 protein domain containing protein, putative [Trypanosoma equiperdum]
MTDHEGSIRDLNTRALGEIDNKVDKLLTLCETDVKLKDFSFAFKLEHAVDVAAFDAGREPGEEVLHLQHVLFRMIKLSLHVARHVLHRTKGFIAPGTTNTEDPVVGGATNAEGDAESGGLQRESSVAELSDGSEAWLDMGATLSHSAVEVLNLTLLSHRRLLRRLQTYCLGSQVLEYITDALTISRDHEITCFLEGFRREHVRLVANLTYENKEVCSAVLGDTRLLTAILGATRIDLENPGMGEWATFVIRNLCYCSNEAREILRGLTPISIVEEADELFGKAVDPHATPEGRSAMEPLQTHTE